MNKTRILMLGLATFPVALQTGLLFGDVALRGGGGGHVISALLNIMTPLRGGGGGHIISALLNIMTPLRGGGGGHIIKVQLD